MDEETLKIWWPESYGPKAFKAIEATDSTFVTRSRYEEILYAQV